MSLKNSKVEMKQLAADFLKLFRKFKKTFSFIGINEERELMFVFKALIKKGILGKRKGHPNVFPSKKYIHELNFNFLKC